MHVRAGQNGADGYATASGVEVQFVALPADLVTLCVLLRTCGTGRVQLKEHLLQCLTTLALQGTWLSGRTHFTFFGTSRFVYWHLRFGFACVLFSLVFFSNRLACLYGRGVAADVPAELIAQGILDHAGMHALNEFTGGKLFKGTTEGGLTGQRKTQIKAAQSAQFAVSLQAIHQRARTLQVQYRLGQECTGQRATISLGLPHATTLCVAPISVDR